MSEHEAPDIEQQVEAVFQDVIAFGQVALVRRDGTEVARDSMLVRRVREDEIADEQEET